MPAIRTQALARHFGDVRAVDGLDLSVEAGELFGLVGPDGAGKTTTMRLLAGILPPTAGDAWVADQHVVRDAEALKLHIGYMSQRFGLYPDLTVLENLAFYAEIHCVPRKVLRERMERLLGFSNLTPFVKRQAGRLSGGMKQKLGLACALIHEPRILLLDEPTNGVDPVSRRDFWRILYQLLQQGVTIFVSTAYLDEAERCARIGMLHQGRLLACAPPRDIKRRLRGQMHELQTDQPRAAAALLRQAVPAVAVSLYGDRLHLLTSDAAQLDAARTALTAAGHAIRTQRAIEPSLEDILVAAMRNPEALADAPA